MDTKNATTEELLEERQRLSEFLSGHPSLDEWMDALDDVATIDQELINRGDDERLLLE